MPTLFGNARNKTKILAIDLGTASISAALIHRQKKESSKTAPGEIFSSEYYCDILKVFRYPIDLLGYRADSSSAAKVPYILKDGFLRAFKDAYGFSKSIDAVLLSLSGPFFLDKKFNKKNIRQNPSSPISKAEANELVASLESEIVSKTFFVAGRDILNAKVSGYNVEDPVGYKGKSLEMEMTFTLISPNLKDYASDAKEKFFPKSDIYYLSDAQVLWRALKSTENLTESVLVADIGGEITGIFRADKNSIEHAEAVAFGVRTLARRVAVSLKEDLAEAEATLLKYTADTLDESKKSKLEQVLSSSLADWWSFFKISLKTLPPAALPKKIILTGAGADFSLFSSFLKDVFQKEFGIEITVEALLAEAFHDFFNPPNAFLGGKDVILASLGLFAK